MKAYDKNISWPSVAFSISLEGRAAIDASHRTCQEVSISGTTKAIRNIQHKRTISMIRLHLREKRAKQKERAEKALERILVNPDPRLLVRPMLEIGIELALIAAGHRVTAAVATVLDGEIVPKE